MLVLLFKEALHMRPGVTADMSALIISQDTNKMLFHWLDLVALLPSLRLDRSALCGADCPEPFDGASAEVTAV